MKRIKKILIINLIYNYFYQWPNNRIRINKIINKCNIRSLDKLKINDYKTSDTLFIMAPGSSVNAYKDSYWEIISKNDSIGINDFIIHDFVPTFYSGEYIRSLEHRQQFIHNFYKKGSEYHYIPIILRGLLINEEEAVDFIKNLPIEINKKIYAADIIEIPGWNYNTFSKSLKIFNFFNAFGKRFKTKSIFFKRTSIIIKVFWAVRMGYKNIVLCGVDLNNTKYFFEENKNYYLKKGILIPDMMQTGHVHSTNDPELFEFTADKLINIINELVLKPKKINLFTALKSSALYPKIPSYFE